jgi:hypothetical protein
MYDAAANLARLALSDDELALFSAAVLLSSSKYKSPQIYRQTIFLSPNKTFF